jgi:tRNA(fMet)-specific endonuclease VapC
VDNALILETTFLIDLERARRKGPSGAPVGFLRSHGDWALYITDVIAGELAMGLSLSERRSWERFIAPFQILPATLDVDWHYARAASYLARNRLTIGANDLWIAAVGLAYDVPVVTANVDHYGRIPDLRVVGY